MIMIEDKVYAYLRQKNMAGRGMKVLVGFSGGADSVALLQLLWEYGRREGIEVQAVHVNHRIRGEEAWRDQRFCVQFCRNRRIPIHVFNMDVPMLAKTEGIGLEEAGRKARYRAYEQMLAEGGFDRVALAHHQNDQAETMLFHLMRGTGPRGIRAMEPVRLPYIRPLLCVTKAEIMEWLDMRSLLWVEDSTNGELDYTRNRIRHQIMEPMEQIRPGSAAHMAKAAQRLGEMEDYLERQAKKAWEDCSRKQDGVYHISLEKFTALHPALQKLTALKGLEELFGGRRDLGSVHVEQICALAKGRRGSRVMLPSGGFAVLGYDEMLLKKGYGTEAAEEPLACLPGNVYRYMGRTYRFELENHVKNEEIPVNCYAKWFDYDKIKNGMVLRTRRAGDYLQTGRSGHKKLKDYLIDSKVPREVRDSCTLLADGSHVIWVVGMRISEEYKVTKETRQVLKVQII